MPFDSSPNSMYICKVDGYVILEQLCNDKKNIIIDNVAISDFEIPNSIIIEADDQIYIKISPDSREASIIGRKHGNSHDKDYINIIKKHITYNSNNNQLVIANGSVRIIIGERDISQKSQNCHLSSDENFTINASSINLN